MRSILLAILILAPFCLVNGQEVSSFDPEDFSRTKDYGYYNYFQLMYHNGKNPTSSEYMKEVFSNGYQGLELRYGFQSTGRQMWQQLHNYPQYGFGSYIGDLGGVEAVSVIGRPMALFFYFGTPIVRFGKFTFNVDGSFGLAFNLKPYDPEENPFQNVIGSKVNMYFNANFILYYRLSDRIDLSLGYGLTHLSNGRMYTPQKGVNTLGLNIGVKYNFNPIKNYTKEKYPDYKPTVRPEYIKRDKPEFKTHHEFQFMYAVGTVLSERPIGEPTGIRYFTSSTTVDWAYQVARKIKTGVGMDMFYDGSLVESYPDWEENDFSTLSKMSFGTHIGIQYLIERFAFIYYFGAYIYKESPARGGWYMRAGGRIRIIDQLHVNLTLKTQNGGIADWIEWGMVYYLKI
ncbi:MAG: acyloxyacyl hydrolase [Bacteroidales bacterium]|nr:acyloxyacyl hydrolase [Bacteroidales bacterium]